MNVCKVDQDRRLVFGWANVAIRADGVQIEDWQGDVIDPDTLEEAGYNFVLKFREANAEHEGGAIGEVVESFVVTKAKLSALGLPEDALPQGWWVGFHVSDESAWASVKDGEYTMFSIEGTATREVMNGDEA